LFLFFELLKNFLQKFYGTFQKYLFKHFVKSFVFDFFSSFCSIASLEETTEAVLSTSDSERETTGRE
jgi:hypothetical protein